jgi:hypothetical protein
MKESLCSVILNKNSLYNMFEINAISHAISAIKNKTEQRMTFKSVAMVVLFSFP